MKNNCYEYQIRPDNRYTNLKYGSGILAIIILEGLVLWMALKDIANFFLHIRN